MAEKNDLVTDDCLMDCLRRFDTVRRGLTVCPKDGSMLRPLADSGLEMVDCYHTDADNFIGMREYVTAFAAINYAHSWIVCFTKLGLFDSAPGDDLFRMLKDTNSETGSAITDEKMAKYIDITNRARKKIRIASPVRTFDRRLANQFLETSETYFKDAVDYRNEGDYLRAFASVNYAHAWLDGGARIGLFDVDGDDVLFTLYE